MLENMVNRPVFNALTKADEEHLLEETGKEGTGHDAPVQKIIVSLFPCNSFFIRFLVGRLRIPGR